MPFTSQDQVIEAAEFLVDGLSATGWTETDGLTIGPPEDERPAVLVERDLFNELVRAVALMRNAR